MKCFLLSLLLLSIVCNPILAQKKPPAVKATTVRDTEEDLRKTYVAADYKKAIAFADRLLAKKPGDQRTLVIKAMSYGMMGNKEMVRKTADVLYPRSPDTEGSFLAVLPINLSKEVMKRDAGWYIAEGHKLAPSSPVVYMVEASIYADDSLFDKSRAAALAGIAHLSDKYPTAIHVQLANLLHISNAKEEAYRFINALSAKYPGDSTIETTHYAMLLRDKKYPDALTKLNGLVTQYPSDKRLRKERAFLYEELGRHGDACADALNLADENDDYFGLLRKLGCPQAFANLDPAQVKAYNYDVDFHGMKYQFIVRPKEIKMNEGARFDWKMTINDAMQGTIAISKAALDTAHGQMNKFSGGNSDLNKLTTVWVSNVVYRELKRDGKSTITASEDGPKTFVIVADEDGDEATITNPAGRTKALKILHIRSDDEKEELWINDDAANPLITHMSLGWSIELKSTE